MRNLIVQVEKAKTNYPFKLSVINTEENRKQLLDGGFVDTRPGVAVKVYHSFLTIDPDRREFYHDAIKHKMI